MSNIEDERSSYLARLLHRVDDKCLSPARAAMEKEHITMVVSSFDDYDLKCAILDDDERHNGLSRIAEARA